MSESASQATRAQSDQCPWEDYKYERDKDECGGIHAENPLAALLAGNLGSLGFLTSTPKTRRWRLSSLQHDISIPAQAAANQAPGMTMAEAVELSYILVQFINTTLLTLFYQLYPNR